MNDASHVDQSIPESVGPYRIVDRIGAGGMGVVYRARDERLERWVAIKHIRPGEADMRSRERLRREARTVAGLSHPSIVQVHDIVETEEGDWIVMELVEGRTLKELVDDDALALVQVVQLAREIAEGLAEAHAKGVVHRDLKTENVKVTALGHAKILDFGLAKRVWHGQKDESLSVQGAILGTGRAMSPEQALGEEVNHLSDLFSFGTLLFESVTRRPPFVGSSLILTMAQICTEDQPSARDLNSEVTRELSGLIDHLLAKDPLQRPQSAGEVVDALQRIAARLASRSMAGDSGDPSDTAPVTPIPLSPPSAIRPMPAIGRLPARSSGARPMAMARPSESTAGIFIKTLVETSQVDSSRLGDRFGDADAYELFSRHDRLTRDVLAEHDGLEIHRTEDGFLFLFERPVDAVEFVLAYHQRLAEFAAELDVELEARAAIHLSEIFLRENTPEEIHRGAKPFEVEGLAKLIVSRVMAMAEGGQTLLTQEAYDMTRRALVGHPLADRKLHWRAHGHYQFSGVDEPVRIFEVATEPIAVDGSLAETASVQRVGETGGSPRFRRPARKRVLLTLAALLPIVVLSAFVRYQLMVGTPPEPAAKTEEATPRARPSLAVLGFRSLTGSPQDTWLSMALAELLTTELRAGEDLRLVAGESVARVKAEHQGLLENETLAPDTLRRIRDDLGTDFVILGSYLSLGAEKQLTVQMNLQDTGRGETIAAVSESGNVTELPDLVSRIGDQVRLRLDLAAVSSDTARAVRATVSDNVEATRRFFQGLARFRDYDVLGAHDDFLEAVRLDPDFAMAHASLSRAWLALGYDAEAAESGQRAYELAQGLPREEFLQIEGTYYQSVADLDGAVTTHRALWRFFPDNVEYGLRLAELQTAAKQGAEALATVEALRMSQPPASEDPRIDLAEARAASETGELERALTAAGRVIAKGRAQGTSTLVAEAQLVRGKVLYRLVRYGEALEALEESRRLFLEADDELGLGLTLFTFAYLEQGERNLSRAEELLREALAIFEKTGSRKRIWQAKNGLGYMIQGKGELKEARQMLEEALQVARDLHWRESETITLDTLSLVLYQLGELARAERMAREVVKVSQQENDRRTEAWAHVNLGFTLLAAGKLAESRSVFEKLTGLAEDTDSKHMAALALGGLGAVSYAMDDLPTALELFEQYREMLSAAGEWGEQALTEPLYASTLLALGRPEEAYEAAHLIAGRFRLAERPIYQAASLQVAAEVLRSQGRFEEAQRQLEEAQSLVDTIENPEVRLRLDLTAARFLATEEPAKALVRLRRLIGEATRLNLKPVELEALLALGEIELLAGSADSQSTGRARLEALAAEAARRGFQLLARRAEESLSGVGAAGASRAAP